MFFLHFTLKLVYGFFIFVCVCSFSLHAIFCLVFVLWLSLSAICCILWLAPHMDAYFWIIWLKISQWLAIVITVSWATALAERGNRIKV